MALSAPILGAAKAATMPDVSVGHLLGHTVLALIVIVGGIWGVQKLWARNRAKASSRPGRASSGLTVVARHTLGKDQHLAVVRWGDREVLVGMTGSNISFFDDGAGAPLPDPHDVLDGASAPSEDSLRANLGTDLTPGRSPFAAALSTVVSQRRTPKATAAPSAYRPVLERLRDLTERS